MKQRTSHTQLADSKEIQAMVATESVRVPIKEKVNLHYPDFTTFKAWMDLLQLDSSFITDVKLSPEEILTGAERIKAAVVEKTLKIASDAALKKVSSDIAAYLGEEDALSEADIILVFGNTNIKRAEHAAELYRKGLAPLMVITGGNPHFDAKQYPEGVAFARRAIELGVPKDHIVIESNSINIADNIKTTLNLLDVLHVPYAEKGIISICEWYPQRRAWCSLMKLSPKGTRIIRSNAPTGNQDLLVDSWHTNEKGTLMIFNEFVKMRISMIVGNIAWPEAKKCKNK